MAVANAEARLSLAERHLHQAPLTADAARVMMAKKGFCNVHPDIQLRKRARFPFGKEKVLHPSCPKCDQLFQLELEHWQLENQKRKMEIRTSNPSGGSSSRPGMPLRETSMPNLTYQGSPHQRLVPNDDPDEVPSRPCLLEDLEDTLPLRRLQRFSQSTSQLDTSVNPPFDRRSMMKQAHSNSCCAALGRIPEEEMSPPEDSEVENDDEFPEPASLLRRTSSFGDTPSCIYDRDMMSVSTLGDSIISMDISMLVLAGNDHYEMAEEMQEEKSEQVQVSKEDYERLPSNPKKVSSPDTQELNHTSLPSVLQPNNKYKGIDRIPELKKPGVEYRTDIPELKEFSEYGKDPDLDVHVKAASSSDDEDAASKGIRDSTSSEHQSPIQKKILCLKRSSDPEEAQELLLELQAPEERSEIVAEGGIQAIQRVMIQYSLHVGVQEEACWTLGGLVSALEEDEHLKTLVADIVDVEIIVNAMRKHRTQKGVQEAAAAAIHNFAYDHVISTSSLLEGGAVVAIVNAMDEHKSVLSIQMSGCSLLGNLASGSFEVQNKIAEVGGIAAIFRACIAHKKNAALQECAIGALSNLACDNDTTKCIISESGGIGFIRSAMVDHAEESGVQEQSFYAIQSLIYNSDENKDKLIGQYRCHQNMLAALRHFVMDPYVLEAALDALIIMTLNHNLSKDALGRNGGVRAIMKVLENHDLDGKLQQAACRVLLNMAHQHCKNKSLMGESGVIPVIIQMLTSYIEDDKVQQVGLKLLTTLCVNDRNKELLGNSGGVEVVVSCMLKHTSAALQEAGCRLLTNLALIDDLRLAIMESNGILAILFAMQLHEDSCTLLAKAIAALQELAVNDTVEIAITACGGMDAIVNAVKNHESHEGIMRNARGAMKNLKCHDGMLDLLLGRDTSYNTQALSYSGSSSDEGSC